MNLPCTKPKPDSLTYIHVYIRGLGRARGGRGSGGGGGQAGCERIIEVFVKIQKKKYLRGGGWVPGEGGLGWM